MKAIATSDWHGDAITMGVPRFEEVERNAWISAHAAVERNADAYICAGDVTDPDSGSRVFRVIRLCVAIASYLRDHGIDSHWLSGNHDVLEDGSGETSLDPLRGLMRIDSKFADVYVYDRPIVRSFGKRASAMICALPFTATSHTYDPAKFVREAKMDGAMVLAHLGIEGIQPGEETTDMPRGRDVILPLDAIEATHPRMIVSGHYHKRQVFKGVQVIGSLVRLTTSAKNDEPGYLVMEF